MPALTIDASLSDIRVLASGLELRNDKAIQESLEWNRNKAVERKAHAAEQLDRAAEIGAEYVKDATTKTRYAPLEERMKYFHPNE